VIDYTKTKLQAALALLATLFALRPFVDDLRHVGFDFLDFHVGLLPTLAGMAALLGVAVHCYALEMIRSRPFSLVERLGNSVFALAVLVLPSFGLGYALTVLGGVLAEQFRVPHLAWMTPASAVGLVAVWLLLAGLVRRRLAHQDRKHQFDQLTETESAALRRAQEMFDQGHYDLCVIEVWRALEARLRRALLLKSVRGQFGDWNGLRDAAYAAGVLAKVPLTALDELRQHWQVAVSVEPLPRPAAETALRTARDILATIPL
jgi:hypothetical protein